MQATNPLSERFTVLDWIGVVLAAFSAVGLLLFPVAGRTFAGMYKDFGSSGDLPGLTRLATSAWFPPLLALFVGASIAMGLRRRPLGVRRAWVVSAFVLGGVSFGLCLVGAYLPVFAIAGAVRAE